MSTHRHSALRPSTDLGAADTAAPEPVDATAPDEPIISAAGLSLSTARGPVFAETDFEAGAGSLLVLRGPSGSGRTALALCLAGRMRPGAGELTVAGHPLPAGARAVQRLSALAEMPGVNPLEGALSVRDHVRERLALGSRWYWPVVSAERLAGAEELLARVAGACGYSPRADTTLVRELPALERFGLGVGLALIGEPRILVVDDVDGLRDADDRSAAWRLLRGLAADGLTVVATAVELDGAAGDPGPDAAAPPVVVVSLEGAPA